MLEKMADFFEARLDGYDEHMLNTIESAQDFYPFTANCLPKKRGTHILDLGCGTGLELEYYFKINPAAKVTGIDLSAAMLDALRAKLPDREITLIQGSYFDIPLGCELYDAAVSVESLHHFTQAEKLPLYHKLCKALKPDGFFILTDYFAPTEEEEILYRQELLRLKKESGISDHDFYHYDTPLTAAHETDALLRAGFTHVEELGCWGATHTLKAIK